MRDAVGRESGLIGSDHELRYFRHPRMYPSFVYVGGLCEGRLKEVWAGCHEVTCRYSKCGQFGDSKEEVVPREDEV
jgi:hypothetical protein